MKRAGLIALIFVVLAGVAQAVADVAYEKKLARAQKRYGKFWDKASGYYGATGRPAPRVAFGQGNRTSIGWDSEGYRQIRLPPGMVKYLGSRGKAHGTGERAKRKTGTLRDRRKYVKGNLIHEWAHVYQDPKLYHEDHSGRESGATLFTDRAGQALLGKKPKTNLTPDQAAFLVKHGEDYVTRGQFGSNWGADPTQIKYPYAPPHYQLRTSKQKAEGDPRKRALRRMLKRDRPVTG